MLTAREGLALCCLGTCLTVECQDVLGAAGRDRLFPSVGSGTGGRDWRWWRCRSSSSGIERCWRWWGGGGGGGAPRGGGGGGRRWPRGWPGIARGGRAGGGGGRGRRG